MSEVTSVLYYVPQDQDEGEEYNAFPVFKPKDQVRLQDIREAFPLPGDYHFRFQHLFNKKTLVWLDLSNEDCALPQVEGQILVKALRLSWHPKLKKAHSDVIEDSRGSPLRTEESKSAGFQKQTSEVAKDLEDIFGAGSNSEIPDLL
jgi:hypothetical protein